VWYSFLCLRRGFQGGGFDVPPYGAVRDKIFFHQVKGVNAITRTRVLAVDINSKTVRLEDLDTSEVRDLSYDRLVLATGSRAKMPPIPGTDLAGITAATNIDEAERIKNAVSKGEVKAAVVVGGGFISLEMAVAFADLWGIPVSVIETAPQILPANLSPLLATMAEKDLQDHGVSVHTSEKVMRFEGDAGLVKRVVTDKRTIRCRYCDMATGVAPDSRLAKEAGLEVTDSGLIVVDEFLRTSDLHIYNGGDVAAVKNRVTGKPGWLPLGSQANRQGRIIGTNLAGGNVAFPGAVGAWGIKLFSLSAVGSGFTLYAAKNAGLDAMSVHVEQMDKAHFYPEYALMALELVVEKGTRRVLGIQGACETGDSLVARINAVTPAISSHGTVEDISTLEVVYSPPFASAMDVVNTVGNVAENALEGRNRTLGVDEFVALWNNRENESVCFVDTRDPDSAEDFVTVDPERWKNIPQDMLRELLHELLHDAALVLVCNTGLRAYEAQQTLDAVGRHDSLSVAGGLSAVRRSGHDIIKNK
jgi:NADPH-dependent 2,4-dienoyl-CoA reductase/sulfur reductase-like enzyme/rhodanese-related sulfurtransferase